MPDLPYFEMPLVTLLAFFVKGATGFGTALIMIPISTILVGVHLAIVASSILDTVAGGILFSHNPLPHCRRYWIPMAGGMVVGSVGGGIVLSFVPVEGFKLFLGIVIVFLGLWFLAGRGGKDESSLPSNPPELASWGDIAVSTFSGFCGGLFGISGPPIVYYLGKRLAKRAFRSILVAVFLFGGIARLTTYTFTGILTFEAILLSIVSLPGLLVGLYLGNHLFVRIKEVWFSRFIGVILILSAVRLLI